MIISRTLEDVMTGKSLELGVVDVSTHSSGSASAKIERTLNSITEASASEEYHIIVAPEYSFNPSTGPLSESKLDRYLEVLRQAAGKTLLIPGTFIWEKEGKLRNSCYVFHDEKIIHQQDKIKNGGEVGLAAIYALKYQAGPYTAPFQWNGLKIGIEICADVGMHAENGVRDLDLVFLISSGEMKLPKSMEAVHQDGYGILVDGLTRLYLAGDHATVDSTFTKMFGRRKKKRFF